MASAVVDMVDVRKSFDDTEVLRGITFSVSKGETFVVMGGSGSGKTVMLRLIAGLIAPDAGRISILGQDIETLSEEELLPIRRHMGFVFQGAALFDSLSVHDNVAFPLREHSRLSEGEIEKRVVHFLSLVGLDRSILRFLPSEISGGMRKRVGIARALVMEPDILLFDEPTAGLDPTNSRLVGDLIAQVHTGICDTSIVVTHDLELVKSISDRVAILIAGRFEAIGRRDDVLNSRDEQVHAFLTGDLR